MPNIISIVIAFIFTLTSFVSPARALTTDPVCLAGDINSMSASCPPINDSSHYFCPQIGQRTLRSTCITASNPAFNRWSDWREVASTCKLKDPACGGITPTCGAPKMICSGQCVNLLTSQQNCGICGKTCGSGEYCFQGACKEVGAGTPSDPGAPIACPKEIKSASDCASTTIGGSKGKPVTEKSNRPADCADGQLCTYYRQECLFGSETTSNGTTVSSEQWCLINADDKICKPDLTCSGTTSSASPSPLPASSPSCNTTSSCYASCYGKTKCGSLGGTVIGKGSCQGTNYQCQFCTTSTVCTSPSPVAVSSPSPIASPVPAAYCHSVVIYSKDFMSLSTSEITKYQGGDQIYLCASGLGNVGEFTKAIFTVNGVSRPEVLLKKPGTQFICDLYTIPADTYSYQISAQVYNSVQGWK